MNLDELRTVQSKERRKDSLQQLRDSFYRDVATYIQDLKASRDRRAQQVDDPFGDDEIRRLSDELETAEEVAEALYERRVGKVVKLASFAAAEMPVDDEGMTGEERELFDDLVARISQNKQTVLDVLSGTADAGETADASRSAGSINPVETTPQQPASATTQTASEPTHSRASTPPESDSVLAEAMGADSPEPATQSATESDPETTPAAGEQVADREPPEPVPPSDVPPAEAEPDAVLGTSTDGGTTAVASTHNDSRQEAASPTPTATEPEPKPEPADNTDTAADSERTTVRITKNVGEIFCVDGREYTLRSEDVVTLPTANAEPLVEQNAAHQLD